MKLRKLLASIAVAAVGVGMMTSAAFAQNLRVLAWDGYADPDWVKAFTAETGIGVDVVFIGSDDEIWAKIKGSEGKDFDVFAVNTAQLQRYIQADLVSPIDVSKLPNQPNVLPRFRDLEAVGGVTKDGKVYGIPFAFDSIGLIYDTNKVKPAPTSMDVMWDPAYKGKVLAYDNGEHNFSFTALTLGYKDPFHLTADQMEKVKEKLVDLKHNVLSFYTTADEAQQIYQNNDVALIWANYGQQQVKAMQEVGAPVAYVNPKEGALAWLDNWVISKGARDLDAAHKWINFMISEKVSSELSQRTGFGNSVTETGSAGANDKLVWLEPVEDPLKRSDLWNEVKATP
ncbi:MAG TPA: ABC transporter substrate-binding protein [Devosiaceae bacterium]